MRRKINRASEIVVGVQSMKWCRNEVKLCCPLIYQTNSTTTSISMGLKWLSSTCMLHEKLNNINTVIPDVPGRLPHNSQLWQLVDSFNFFLWIWTLCWYWHHIHWQSLCWLVMKVDSVLMRLGLEISIYFSRTKKEWMDHMEFQDFISIWVNMSWIHMYELEV